MQYQIIILLRVVRPRGKYLQAIGLLGRSVILFGKKMDNQRKEK
jgi:hypothetical protein